MQSKQIVVFGATGATGTLVVEQALDAGHRVVGFSRRPQPERARLRWVVGDVRCVADVRRAVAGADAVIVALGAPPSDRSGLREEGTRAIAGAMDAEGVDRVVAMTVLGAGDSYAGTDWFTRWVVLGLWLRHVLADHESQERVLRESGLIWTAVRPPHLDDRDRGDIQTFQGAASAPAMRVGRADVARFLLGCALDGTWAGQAVGVSA